jgi:hypothetical protein
MNLTQAHWRILAEAPIAVFSLVAAADDHISTKEREAMLLAWAPKLSKMKLANDAAHHEVYRYILQERCEEALKNGCLLEESAAKLCLKQTAAILASELNSDEAGFLRNALVILARDVAKASSSFFGLGAQVGSEEQSAIRQIGHLLSG